MTTAREVVERLRRLGHAIDQGYSENGFDGAAAHEAADRIESQESQITQAQAVEIVLKRDHAALQAALDEAVDERRCLEEVHADVIDTCSALRAENESIRSRLRAYESGDAGKLVERLEDWRKRFEGDNSLYGWAEPVRFKGQKCSDDLAEAIRALRAADAEKRRLESLLNGRDEFIVAQGLWMAFVETLRARTATGGEG